MTVGTISLPEACTDPQLFGRWFRERSTWAAWFAYIAALFAQPMTEAQLATYRHHTGRQAPPATPVTEGWLICGRRAGKSFTLALIAVYLACFRSYAQFLGPGERATIAIIAADRKQARQIFRYIRGIIEGTPLLAPMIQGDPRADSLDLTNHVTIEIGTASFRTSRGYSFAAILCDEVAFWPTDTAAEPDYAVLDALRPGLANIPGAVLLCASSPYAKRGALWDAFKQYFGKDDADVFVWKAATREMNPTIAQAIIDRATERDPENAAAEYGAEFRSDIAAFVSREAVEAVVEPGCFERPHIPGSAYAAFVDPSGGMSDSMTLAIAHRETLTDVAVLDCVREVRPPFSPDRVVSDFCETLKTYGITSVRGDRYGGEWCREPFRQKGIAYDVADATKNDLYRSLLPALNSRKVDLLDHKRLVAQILGLERRTARGGRDSVDHAPNAHDDIANAVAGALHYSKVSAPSAAVIDSGFY